jgi:hypothetical protein
VLCKTPIWFLFWFFFSSFFPHNDLKRKKEKKGPDRDFAKHLLCNDSNLKISVVNTKQAASGLTLTSPVIKPTLPNTSLKSLKRSE